MEKQYPSPKEVLKLLGAGVLITACFVAPGLPLAIGAFAKGEREKEWKKLRKEWKKYNLSRLKQTLKRLYEQKTIEVVETKDGPIVKLTNKGKLRLLRYKLEEMQIKKPLIWDRKWRLIIYDIPKKKKKAQEVFRRILKGMKFLQLQKSVYLCPYPCEKEIEFLRELYGIGKYVVMLVVEKIENDKAYREYFGL